MPSFPKITVDTMEALAVSVAVFKQHNNRVVQFKDGVPGNKEEIVNHFVNGSNLNLDAESADVVKKSIAHAVTMNSIAGKSTPDFVFKIFELLEKDKVSTKAAGILAWAPKVSHDIIKTEEDRTELFRVGINSKHIHPIGGRLIVKFQPMKCHYIKAHNTYCYTGHDSNGNLVRFYFKKKINGLVTISAKIKTHIRDVEISNSDVTVLNYVKELI